MRILSLSFPLPGAPIHNHSFANAPTFFASAALVRDTAALSPLTEQVVAVVAGPAPRPGHRVGGSCGQYCSHCYY